eukprot:gene29216-7191_t
MASSGEGGGGARPGQANSETMSQRERALAVSSTQQKTDASLAEASRQIEEAQSSGIAVLEALQQQRGTVQKAGTKLTEVGGELDKAEGLLKTMEKRNT